MAMNKSEKALVEGLKIRLALRFTDDAAGPDIPIPQNAWLPKQIVYGYSIIGSGMSLRVSESHSLSSSHTKSEGGCKNETRSQGGICQFSTRLRALKALRNMLEIECAMALRKIDIQIEKELGGGE